MHSTYGLPCLFTLLLALPPAFATDSSCNEVGTVNFYSAVNCGGTMTSKTICNDGNGCHDLDSTWKSYEWTRSNTGGNLHLYKKGVCPNTMGDGHEVAQTDSCTNIDSTIQSGQYSWLYSR